MTKPKVTKPRAPRKPKTIKVVAKVEEVTVEKEAFKSTIEVADDVKHIKVTAKPENPELTWNERFILLKAHYTQTLRSELMKFQTIRKEAGARQQFLIKILQKDPSDNSKPSKVFQVQHFDAVKDFDVLKVVEVSLDSIEPLLMPQPGVSDNIDPLVFMARLAFECIAAKSAKDLDQNSSLSIAGTQASAMDLHFYHISATQEVEADQEMDSIHFARALLIDKDEYQMDHLVRILDRWYPIEDIDMLSLSHYESHPSIVDLVEQLKEKPMFGVIRLTSQDVHQDLITFKKIEGLLVRANYVKVPTVGDTSLPGTIIIEITPRATPSFNELFAALYKSIFRDVSWFDSVKLITDLSAMERETLHPYHARESKAVIRQIQGAIDHCSRENHTVSEIIEVVKQLDGARTRLYLDSRNLPAGIEKRSVETLMASPRQASSHNERVFAIAEDEFQVFGVNFFDYRDFRFLTMKGRRVIKVFVQGQGRESFKVYSSEQSELDCNLKDIGSYAYAPGCYVPAYSAMVRHYSTLVQGRHPGKKCTIGIQLYSETTTTSCVGNTRNAEELGEWVIKKLSEMEVSGNSAWIELSYETRPFSWIRREVYRIMGWL